MNNKYVKMVYALMVIMGVYTAVQAKDIIEKQEKGCIDCPIEESGNKGDEPDE